MDTANTFTEIIHYISSSSRIRQGRKCQIVVKGNGRSTYIKTTDCLQHTIAAGPALKLDLQLMAERITGRLANENDNVRSITGDHIK